MFRCSTTDTFAHAIVCMCFILSTQITHAAIAPPPDATKGVHYGLSIEDKPEEKLFEIVIHSRISKKLCIRDGDWPASKARAGKSGALRIGSLHFASESVHAVVDGERIPIRVANFGYPARKSGSLNAGYVVIEPFSNRRSIIPYTEFDGKFDHDAKKDLIYDPDVLLCPQ